MDRLHKIHFIERKVPGRDLTRKQTTSRPDKLWPEMEKHMSDASKRKAKQKWFTERPKLDNASRLRGTYSIDPEDEEFKHTMKNACRRLGDSDASSNAL